MGHQQTGGNDESRDETDAGELWEAMQDDDFAAEEPDPDDFYPEIVASDALAEDDPKDRPNKE